MRLATRTAAAAMAVLLAAGAANAKVYELTYTGAVSFASAPGATALQPFTFTLQADNGGASSLNQVWTVGDLTGFTLKAGSYSQTFSKLVPISSPVDFTTDSAGRLTAPNFFVTNDRTQTVDSIQSWIGDALYEDGLFFAYLARRQSIFATAPGASSGWTVSGPGGVPEPASWAMLVLGVAMIGFAARRRARALPSA